MAGRHGHQGWKACLSQRPLYACSVITQKAYAIVHHHLSAGQAGHGVHQNDPRKLPAICRLLKAITALQSNGTYSMKVAGQS